MLLLVFLIIILATYLVTNHYAGRKLSIKQQEIRDEFHQHIEQKEYDHRTQINALNSDFSRKMATQVDQFSLKYTNLKREYEDLVREGRKDAVKRSRHVVSGQVYEQISPLVPGFPYELKDVRHVGSPLDFLIFNGLYDSSKELEVVFLEIKSGMSALNANERRVKKAIDSGRVRYDVFHPDIDHDTEEKLEASVTPLRAVLQPGEMIKPAPSNSIAVDDDGTETLKCGHCKKMFKRPVAPGRKPLFCPNCRGTG